jgi:hypothetical protein
MQDPADGSKRPTRARFGLHSLMLVTSVFCVMGAAGYHLLRTHVPLRSSSQTAGLLAFILITLVAPVLLLTAISLGRQLFGWLQGRPWRKRPGQKRP